MIGIYFSGTGNTKYCVDKFIEIYGNGFSCPIEDRDIVGKFKNESEIVLGYPVYFSNIPKIVRDFIIKNAEHFHNKRVFVIATNRIFSGDGAGCSARLLKRYGAKITGGLHLKMPDSIGDEKVLKKSIAENNNFVRKAEQKISIAVQNLKNGHPPKEGLSVFHRLAGFLGQRLLFGGKAMTYHKNPKICADKCIGCGVCAEVCPMNNIQIVQQKAVSATKCTLCYRCFSKCPTQALTILGEKVYEQCQIEKYL